MRALLLLPLAAASCNAILGFEDTHPRLFMHTCAEWRGAGETDDGEYEINPHDGPTFHVWCANMSGPGVPTEYLSLTAPSAADAATALQTNTLSTISNYAIQQGGGDCACPGAEVTTFSKVKLDVDTMEIDIFDRTYADVTYTQNNQSCFATTSGCTAGETGFGAAANCNPAQDLASRSQAAVDITGNDVQLKYPSWVRTGRLSVGQAVAAADHKSAVIQGGGDCGGMVPQNGRLPVEIPFTANDLLDPMLINGGFEQDNLNGWTSTGGGAAFVLLPDPALGGRLTLSSYVGSSDAVQGTVSQTFTVPSNAVAIEFAIAGTGGRVVLKDGATELQVATPSIDAYIEQSFWIADQTGKSLTLVIEDATTTAHIKVSGFDVRRGDAPSPIVNPGFVDLAPFAGWTLTGDLTTAATVVAEDPSHGTWLAASTSSGQGAIAQTFTVPSDAVALHFAMTGGTQTARLYTGTVTIFPSGSPVYTATGPGDALLHAVSWDLSPYRGQQMTIAFEDVSTGSAFSVLQLNYVNARYWH
jgi:hypothetical protein